MAERSVRARTRISWRTDAPLISLLLIAFVLLVFSSGGALYALAGSDSWSGAPNVCTSPQVSTTTNCTFTAEVAAANTTEPGEWWNKSTWYKFVPASTATIYIRAESPGYDNTLYLRDSSGTILTQNDDSYSLDAAVSYSLTSGSTYYVGVGSYRNSGIPSVSVLLTMSRPDAPTSVTASVNGTSGTASVTWTQADISTRSVTGFTVNAYTGGSLVLSRSVSGSPPSTSYAFSGLTNGTAYTFRVSATNSVGTSELSTESSAVTPYGVQTVTFATLASRAYGSDPFTVSATTNAPGATIEFSSTTTAVCTSDGNTVTIVNVGTCSITATGSAVTGWSSGSTTRTFTVTAKSLTVSGFAVTAREYNGNQTMAVTGSGVLNGVIATDSSNVSLTGAPIGTADSKNVGTRTVTISGLSLTGAAASKYSLSAITVSGQITAKPLTISSPTVASREYNGSTTVTVTPGTVSGYVSPETLTISAIGVLDSPNAGERTATVSYTLANGTNGGVATNYSLPNGSTQVTISRRVLVVTGTTVADKAYNKSTNATVTLGTVSNYVGAERPVVTASGTFASANPGIQPVTITYDVADDVATSALGANYEVASASLSAEISKAILTFTVTARDRSYNGANSATLVVGPLVGVKVGDDVTINDDKVTGTFGDAEPGSNKLVSLTLASGLLVGADADKYVFQVPANPRADITKANQTGFEITNASSFVADGSLTLQAAGGQTSGNISFSVASGPCQITNSRLTSSRGGTSCVINATRSGDSRYNSASSSLSVRVDKVAQNLYFRSQAPSSPAVGSTYTVNVESDVSLAPTIVIANSSSTVCSISAGIVSFNAVGTCLISASQSGNDVYGSAAASQSVTVVAVPVTSTTVPSSTGANGISPSTSVPQSAVAAPVPSSSSTSSSSTSSTTTTTTTTIPADPSKPILGADGEPVELAAGETTVLIRGEEVVVNTVQEDGQLVMTLPNNVVVRIGARVAGGASAQVGPDGVLRAYRNSEVVVELKGLVPGTTFTVFMFSTPIELGRGSVNADGTVSQTVKLPGIAEIGSHTLQVNGVGPGGEVVSVSMGIKVEKKQSNTAAAILAISAAILLALLGGRPIFTRRRRRS